MTNQNEVANTQDQETEIVEAHIVKENDQYVVLKDENGKFKRKAKYEAYSSIVAQTREEKIWLGNLFEGTEDSGNGLKDHVGKVIEVADFILRPYDKIDEDTGATEYGVLTYLITPDRIAYVTSAKAVYFTVKNTIMALFGKPTDEDWKNVQIQVLKEKRERGDAIKIKIVG